MNRKKQKKTHGFLAWEKKKRMPSPIEKLAESTFHEWYDEKHRTRSTDEVQFLNELKRSHCPRCNSDRVTKDGKDRKGINRFRCKECGKRFGPLSGTLLDNSKIPISEWFEFILHLLEEHSTYTSATDNRNAETTGYYWLSKVFIALDDIQNRIVLRGEIWLDETYWHVDPENRLKRPDGTMLRGISRNKICICVATDKKNVISLRSGGNKPSIRTTLAMAAHLEEKSTIHHDGERSHSILVAKKNLVSIVHPTKKTKGLKDKDNPMEPINRIHADLKRFLRAHKNFKERELQGFLNLFSFKKNNANLTYPEMASVLLERMALTPKMVRYRTFYSKKAR